MGVDKTSWMWIDLSKEFPFLHVFLKTETFIFYSADSALQWASESSCTLSELGIYSAVTVILLFNSSSQISLKRQIIFRFIVPPIFIKKFRANMLSIWMWTDVSLFVLKSLPEPAPKPIVPLHLYAFSFPSKTMSLYLEVLPTEHPSLLKKYLFLRRTWAGAWTNTLSLNISISFIHQRSFIWDTLLKRVRL